MNKEEFLSKRYAIDLKIKKLNGESYEHTDIWKIEVL